MEPGQGGLFLGAYGQENLLLKGVIGFLMVIFLCHRFRKLGIEGADSRVAEGR